MKKHVIWLIGLLMAFPAFAASDDTPAGATVLVISTNLNTYGPDALATNDLADWFSIDLVVSNRYRFESTGLSNVNAELYSDSNETTMVASDLGHGISNNFQLVFDADVSQTYYLKVYDNAGGAAEYSLEYKTEPFYDAWDDVDDIYSNAPTLTATGSEQTHGVHTLDSVDTEDWFHFYLIAGVDYTFRAVNGGWDTVGELYNRVPENPGLSSPGMNGSHSTTCLQGGANIHNLRS